MPGLLASPLAGRHVCDAAEEPCEIVDVGDAAGCRNILHRQEGTAQQLLGVFDAVGVDVVRQRHADFLFEQRGQVACIQKQLVGKTFQA